MVGWHHWLNGHEFEQVLGAGDGQGRLACSIPWGCKESDMTEWLNWLKVFENGFTVYNTCGIDVKKLETVGLSWYSHTEE